MPRELPNCNSLRVQRASRLNSIEDGRLDNNLHLLNKEFRRARRLANQDMRVINLTLEFIQNSSGHSPEGLPPQYKEKGEIRKLAPCFMYGERVISRKYRRTQSAAPLRAAFSRRGSTSSCSVTSTTGEDYTTDSLTETDDTTATNHSSSSSSARPRPQSSPVRRRSVHSRLNQRQRPGTAKATVNRLSDSLSDLSVLSAESDTEPETMIQRISAENMNKPKRKLPLRSKTSDAVRIPSARHRQTSTFLTDPVQDSGSELSLERPISAPRSRRAWSARSASSRSPPAAVPQELQILERVIDLPPTSKIRQEKVLEYKKVMNKNKAQSVDQKLQSFMSSLPSSDNGDQQDNAP